MLMVCDACGTAPVLSFSRSITINMSVVPPSFTTKPNDYEVLWVKVDPNPARTRYDGHLPSQVTSGMLTQHSSAVHRRPRHSNRSCGPTELVGTAPIHGIDEAELTSARPCA